MEKKINKLIKQKENLPVIAGKVTGSSKDFPYTEVRTSVLMNPPEQLDHIEKLMLIKQKRLSDAIRERVEIEEYIAAIDDSELRRIFEMRFVDGLSQREISEKTSLDRSVISRKISNYIKLHT